MTDPTRMRDMTEGERYRWYTQHEWPCGHGKKYLPGPRGGLMRNVMCPTCEMKLNVVDPESEFADLIDAGQVIEAPANYTPPSLPLRLRAWNFMRAAMGM